MTEAFAASSQCYPLHQPKRALMKSWLTGKKLYLGETNIGNRYFILTRHEDHPRFMDIITGSMYETRGRCLCSSYLYIKTINRVTPDLNELVDELKKKVS